MLHFLYRPLRTLCPLLMPKPPLLLILFVGSLALIAGPTTVAQESADSAQLVTINFDEVPPNAIILNQYQPKVIFSAMGFSAGSGGFWGYDLYTKPIIQYSTNRALFSSYNPSIYYWGDYEVPGEIYLDFSVPVNDFRFTIHNYYSFYAAYNNPIVYVDVYTNRTFHGTYYVYANGSLGSILVTTLSSIQNITGIRIYNVNNYDRYNRQMQLYYDDFQFKPNFDVRITSPRVSGVLNGTTQRALVGANAAFFASVIPSGTTGGSFAWTFEGPYQLVAGNLNSSSVTIKATNVGTITGKVTYMLNGFTAQATVTIDAVLPTLTQFTAAQTAPDGVYRDQYCANLPSLLGAQVSLDCYRYGGPDKGMILTARASIPSGTYITDLAQTGIKVRQIISTFRKWVNDRKSSTLEGNGNFRCDTKRASETDVNSGWQLDGAEAMTAFVHSPPTFAQGTTIEHVGFDSPGRYLDSPATSPTGYSMIDAFFGDDRFQTYAYYYVGDPLNPVFQRPLKLATEGTYAYSLYNWKWNLQTNFGAAAPLKYWIRFSNTPSLTLAGTNVVPTLNGNVSDNPTVQCPGDTTIPSTNMIDGARCFVLQQYWDLYNRAPDQGGWDYWTNEIASCEFDRLCIAARRKAVATAFFFQAEFQTLDPAMANPPGTPNFDPAVYNPAFVSHCYYSLLRRPPDVGGFNWWVNNLNQFGDYGAVVYSFTNSPEYRGRANFHDCP